MDRRASSGPSLRPSTSGNLQRGWGAGIAATTGATSRFRCVVRADSRRANKQRRLCLCFVGGRRVEDKHRHGPLGQGQRRRVRRGEQDGLAAGDPAVLARGHSRAVLHQQERAGRVRALVASQTSERVLRVPHVEKGAFIFKTIHHLPLVLVNRESIV